MSTQTPTPSPSPEKQNEATTGFGSGQVVSRRINDEQKYE